MRSRLALTWTVALVAWAPVVSATDHLVSQGLSVTSYSASSSYGGHTPEFAFDGDPGTYWNASAAAPEWIEVDLGLIYSVVRVRMRLNLSSDGPCSYEVWNSDSPIQHSTTGASLAAQHSGICRMGDDIELSLAPGSVARHLQVRTLQSAGWAAWFEVQVFAQCSDADDDGYFYEGGCGTDPDCNDASASSHPGAAESCDGFDNDCDSTPDNSPDCHRQCSLPGELGSELRTIILEYSLEPKLARTGSGFGLAWEDFQDGDYEIFFTVLDPGGMQISPVVQITNNSFPDFGPSLVWTGAQFGLAWSGGQREAHYKQFARLATDGAPIGASTAVTTSPRNSMLPSLVWNGHGYGVAWYDYRDDPAGYRDEIYFARLDAVGNKIGSDVRVTATCTSAEYPSLGWSGTEYGLAWHDYRDPTPLCCSEIYFARLDPLGTHHGSQVRITNAPGFSAFPTLVSAGDGWASFAQGA